MSFAAKFNGTCASVICSIPIKPGDQVEYVGRELMHIVCAQPKVVCAQCNTQHKGECW